MRRALDWGSHVNMRCDFTSLVVETFHADGHLTW
jgi:hypothetical protein